MKALPTPLERLTRSRNELRLAMGELHHPATPADDTGAQAPVDGWRAALMQNPAARVLLALSRAWWARQPLRLVMPLAQQSAQALLAPAAQQHPLGLVLGAATVGAALVWVRPWRWFSVAALLAKALPAVLSEIARQSPGELVAAPRSHKA